MTQTKQEHNSRIPLSEAPAQPLTSPQTSPAPTVKITVRAVVIGIALGIFACWGGYMNDYVMGMSMLNVGHLPVILVGVVIVAMMTVNPLLGLLERALGSVVRLRILPAEWAVILAIGCVAVPVMNQVGATLPPLANIAKQYASNTGWKNNQVLLDSNDKLTYLPENVILSDGRNDEAISAYLNGPPQGKTVDGQYMAEAWQAWAPVLTTWMPILLSFFIALMAITLVVHRQWATREHIRFPIADFISTIVHGRPQSTMESAVVRQSRPLFQSPAFWIFFGVIFGVHLLNGLATMYYTNLPKLPLTLDMFAAISQKFPKINTGGLAWMAYQGLLFPSIIAFAFFLSREVSLAIGLTPLIHEIYIVIMVNSYGINPREASDVCWGEGFFNMGAFLGIFLSILWLGRSYYFPLIAEAVGLGPVLRPGKPRMVGVWAMRVFLLGTFTTIALLVVRVGIEWPFALMFVAVLLIVQVVIARINVESGLFIFGLLFFGNEAIISIFGFDAMGPRLVMLSALFMIVIISSHGSQPLVPIAINVVEVCRRQKLNVGRVGILAGLMIAIALAVTTYVSMDTTYHKPDGAEGFKGKYSINDGQWPLMMGDKVIDKGKTNGTLDHTLNMSTWERLTSPSPVRGLAVWCAIGFGLTVLLSILRLRFTWWPIHPLVLTLWGVAAVAGYGFSFLIGWMIRSAITSLFGETTIEKVKPAMVGVIAGELVAAAFWLGVGWVDFSYDGILPATPYKVYR